MPEKPLRVMLIDDDRDDYLLTRELFEEIPGNGFSLDWAPDYDSGLEAIERCEHDVFLLDHRLGGRTGLELLREVMRKGCKSPVILLTGQHDRELDQAALEAGASDYLVKGEIDAASLERSVRYALQQKRHAEELESRVRERTEELARANAQLQEEVAERRRAEEALREAHRRKDEFLAMLAHELRNPLAPIRNALEVLRLAGDDPARREEARAVMERQLQQAVRLVDDLLDLARIGQGKIELRRERVPLASVVQRAVETSRPLLESADHQLTVCLPAQPVLLDADPARLAQVLSNLLNNAAKYTEPGGHVWLTAEVQREGAQGAPELTLRVRDTGVGIPPEVLPQVFELFAQEERSRGRSQGGLGVGLTLVRGLVELHGGTVEAVSDGPGRGSEFIVRLPLPRQEALPKGNPGAAPELSGPPLSSRKKVLVVDDNRDAAESLSLLLRLNGYEVRTAYDGEAALQAARDYLPDVAVLDLGLPRMDGYEVARRIRQEPALAGITLVAASGYGQEEDRRRSGEAGFDQHLIKPVEMEDLLGILNARP
jgi:signal transduction histidine kinase